MFMSHRNFVEQLNRMFFAGLLIGKKKKKEAPQ